jgi:hypothetical protein
LKSLNFSCAHLSVEATRSSKRRASNNAERRNICVAELRFKCLKEAFGASLSAKFHIDRHAEQLRAREIFGRVVIGSDMPGNFENSRDSVSVGQ